MSKGFYFDMTSCIGCRTCQVACKDKNDLPIGVIYRNVTCYEAGTFPAPKVFHISASCNHCDNPACLAACPVGAIYKTEDGTVIIDRKLCQGCQQCVSACPYGVPVYNEELGITGKCDGCIALRKNGSNPACVDSCPMRALDFGDTEELAEKYGKDLINEMPNQYTIDADISKPNVLIQAKAAALKDGAQISHI